MGDERLAAGAADRLRRTLDLQYRAIRTCVRMAARPGRLYTATDGRPACEGGEWCLVAHLRDEDEDAFAAEHDQDG